MCPVTINILDPLHTWARLCQINRCRRRRQSHLEGTIILTASLAALTLWATITVTADKLPSRMHHRHGWWLWLFAADWSGVCVVLRSDEAFNQADTQSGGNEATGCQSAHTLVTGTVCVCVCCLQNRRRYLHSLGQIYSTQSCPSLSVCVCVTVEKPITDTHSVYWLFKRPVQFSNRSCLWKCL